MQELLPVEAAADRLKNVEIPDLERQKKDQEVLVSEANAAVEKVNFFWFLFAILDQLCLQMNEEVMAIRRQQKELGLLKQHASTVSRTQKEIETSKEEMVTLETELAATGSTRTIDDVQQEIDNLTADM